MIPVVVDDEVCVCLAFALSSVAPVGASLGRCSVIPARPAGGVGPAAAAVQVARVGLVQLVAAAAATGMKAGGIRPALGAQVRPPRRAVGAGAVVAVALGADRSVTATSGASMAWLGASATGCRLDEEWPEYDDKSCPDEDDQVEPDGLTW